MKKIKMIISIALALIIIAAVALRLAVPELSKQSAAGGVSNGPDGVAALADCPDTPNCVSSEATDSARKIERFNIENDSTSAIATLAEIISSQANTEIVEQNERYLHATFTTKLMGYVDDLEYLISDDNQSVQVRSASRLGKSDLGANGKRVEMLRGIASGKL